MGVAIPLAVSKSRPVKAKNVIRVFALFAIGLLLNIISDFDFPNRTKYATQFASWESCKG